MLVVSLLHPRLFPIHFRRAICWFKAEISFDPRVYSLKSYEHALESSLAWGSTCWDGYSNRRVGVAYWTYSRPSGGFLGLRDNYWQSSEIERGRRLCWEMAEQTLLMSRYLSPPGHQPSYVDVQWLAYCIRIKWNVVPHHHIISLNVL